MLIIDSICHTYLQVRTLCSLHVTAALTRVVTLNVHGGARHLAHAVRVCFAQEDLKLLKLKSLSFDSLLSLVRGNSFDVNGLY